MWEAPHHTFSTIFATFGMSSWLQCKLGPSRSDRNICSSSFLPSPLFTSTYIKAPSPNQLCQAAEALSSSSHLPIVHVSSLPIATIHLRPRMKALLSLMIPERPSEG